MTLLGELYANGFGVAQNDKRAAEWYKLAAERGDREAMFQLAMFRFGGRSAARDQADGVALLTKAAQLGHGAASYDLGLLYLEGQQFPQDFTRAAELFLAAARAGISEAQFALAMLYREGRGVAKDEREVARWLAAGALAGNLDAMVEYAIALFNGTGVAKDRSAATELFWKAARRGSPIAQNRLARILTGEYGQPADPGEAIKWHLVAKASGAASPELDDYMQRQNAPIRKAAEKAANSWLIPMARPRS